MDADIEATVDLAVRQARDVAAFTRGIIDGFGCATCGGGGWVSEPDSTSSPWFPKKPIRTVCKDCGGTGRDPAQETP